MPGDIHYFYFPFILHKKHMNISRMARTYKRLLTRQQSKMFPDFQCSRKRHRGSTLISVFLFSIFHHIIIIITCPLIQASYP